jgi:hypothetical protein
MRKKIIFVSYGGGHVNMLLPVIKILQALPGFEVIVLGLTTAGAVLERNQIPYLGFKDLLHLADDSALFYGNNLVGANSASSLVSIEESVAYMGLNYWELVNKYGEQKAHELYTSKGRHSFYPIGVLKRFLSEQKPDLVVATNSPRAERAAIDAAGELNIPSLCLIDLFVFQSVKWIGLPKFATKVCVLSNFVKEQLLAAGRLDQEIVVTGNPVFDSLSSIKSNTPLLMSNRRWKNAQKVILWASQVEPEVHPFDATKKGDVMLPRRIETLLFKVLSKHPDWHLILRPHPSDNTEYFDIPENVEIGDKAESLHELIASVDCVITMTSTVAIEAALIGKQVITIDLSIFTEDSPYSKMGLSEGVVDLTDLESVLCRESLASNLNTEAVVGLPGFATENVVKTIQALLKNSL